MESTTITSASVFISSNGAGGKPIPNQASATCIVNVNISGTAATTTDLAVVCTPLFTKLNGSFQQTSPVEVTNEVVFIPASESDPQFSLIGPISITFPKIEDEHRSSEGYGISVQLEVVELGGETPNPVVALVTGTPVTPIGLSLGFADLPNWRAIESINIKS